MAFRKGQKVVCIAVFYGIYSKTRERAGAQALPEIEEVYTCDGYSGTGGGIYLKEIAGLNSRGYRTSFISHKFAPLQYQSCKGSKELAKDFVLTEERIEITKKELA